METIRKDFILLLFSCITAKIATREKQVFQVYYLMAYTIALAGKGGTGKTTLAGITIRYLIEKRKQPVLAVDADSNNCLNEALGVNVHATVGKLREDSLQIIRNGAERPGGMSMEQLFDYQVQQSLIESKGVDLLVMGRPEGPGCYCAANNIIRKYTDKLSETYPYVVIDNEAGMEHLSRRTTHRVNLLIIASDPSVRGLQTAKRIDTLVSELDLDIASRVLLINRISGDEGTELQALAERLNLRVGGVVPHDDLLLHLGLKGDSVFHLPADAKSLRSLYAILDTLNIT
ncbi:MAG: AAA family ATPase [Thermodesulfovibrionales bacterium]|nr:AAA family ATPase [Thermodesulfovibrionales bacterium]